MALHHLSRLVTLLAFGIASITVLHSQEKEGHKSIFSEPIKLDASVRTERATRSEQRGDTLIYNAAAYQVIENADSERLISKMPGIIISDSGIEANGKEVKRILLDGQEFFGNDVLTALRNVPADMIKQIEIINRLSDTARETGIDDGEGHTALNIVTKRKRGTSMYSGRFYGSGGIEDKANTSDKPQGRYIAGGNLTRFGEKNTVSIIGMSNNINKFNFSSADIVSGTTSLDASRGNTFKVKSLSGISNVNSVGLNYTSKEVNLNYFFSDINNFNAPYSHKFTQTSTLGKELSTISYSDYNAHNSTHKFDGKITLKPAKRHSITIRPNFSYENLSNGRSLYSLYDYVYEDGREDFQRKQKNNADNSRFVLKTGVNLSYVYRFKKKRRSLSLYGGYNLNWQKGLDQSWEYRWSHIEAETSDVTTANSTNIQNRYRHSIQHIGTGKLTYTEPLSKRSTLSGEYSFTVNYANGENLVYPFNNKEGLYSETPKERVSAISTSTYLSHTMRLRYNYVLKKTSITAAVAYLNTIYNGAAELPYSSATTRTFHHPLYTLIVNLPINKSNVFRLEANGRTINPANSSLQDIVDRSSTSNVKAGNPNLKPAYTHKAQLSYIHTNKKAGTTLSISGSYTGSPNYFCDSLVINNPDFVVMIDENGKPIKLGKDNQYTKRINMGGYHKADYKVSFGVPLDFMRCNFNISTQGSNQRIPGMINDEIVPISRDWYQLAGRLDSNISKKIDFTVRYHFRYTLNDYNGKFGSVQNNFFTHRASAQLRWILPADFTFTGGFIFQQNVSTIGLYKDNIYLCDLFLGKRFLKSKRLEFNIGVNDLLNSSLKSYWHSISATGRSDGYNIGIGRYFSLQCIWHFRAGNKPKN